MSSIAFYLLPMRMWELTLGGVLALNVFKAKSNRFLNSFIAISGMAMILLPLSSSQRPLFSRVIMRYFHVLELLW
jgi:hypothetical protein